MMASFQLELAEALPCRTCGTAVPVEEPQCSNCGGECGPYASFEEFFSLLEQSQIICGRQGGLVLGRDGPEDDIPLIAHVSGGQFQCVGYMQGGEYLVCAQAAETHRARLDEINADTGPASAITAIEVTKRTSVINTNKVEGTAALWIHTGQFIINRFATAKHMAELERINWA